MYHLLSGGSDSYKFSCSYANSHTGETMSRLRGGEFQRSVTKGGEEGRVIRDLCVTSALNSMSLLHVFARAGRNHSLNKRLLGNVTG